MAKERLFFTGSTRIINDPRPSGLDMRVYACVSLHDGMSLLKGTGRGCYATFATLTAELGCDAANLSRSIKRLVDWGYLTEERQTDRRRKSFRVTFETAESWQSRQQSDVAAVVEIVGNGMSGNAGNPPLVEQHYSSLKELDLPKEKLDSSEEARLSARGLGKRRLGSNDGAQLAMFERAFRDAAGRIGSDRLKEIGTWLQHLTETLDPDDPNYRRAQRLYFDVEMAIWERSPDAAELAA